MTNHHKQSIIEHAERIVSELTEKGMELSDVAMVLDTARGNVRELAFERLRRIEAETGQLKLIVGDGPKQRASDRGAEDQTVLDLILRGPPATAVDLAQESKVGARISAILARLAKRGVVECHGKGPKALWGTKEAFLSELVHPTTSAETPPAPPPAPPPPAPPSLFDEGAAPEVPDFAPAPVAPPVAAKPVIPPAAPIPASPSGTRTRAPKVPTPPSPDADWK
jgi:hypothetical protein